MSHNESSTRGRSNSYNLFILVLTVFSLLIMVVMFLPLDEATLGLLRFYDNLICVIFLIDFFINLRAASHKRDYFIKQGGWLDLLGSIPSLGGSLRFTGLFRLARLSRLARITRLLRGQGGQEIAADVLKNRSQYTAFITILLTIIILATASVLVLQFEGQAPDAKITTGRDAFWYSIVTITTVGYGDYYPVTAGGRITAMFIMFAGVGIIGVLASILSSILVGEPSISVEEDLLAVEAKPKVEEEIAAIKAELAAMHQLLRQVLAEGDKQ
jgi:voltage-gated potassium channel